MRIDQKVKIKRYEGDMGSEDLGASGLVIHSNRQRFGHYINDVMFYMGEIKEFPSWCVISTTKLVLNNSRHFMIMIRKDDLEKVKEE